MPSNKRLKQARIAAGYTSGRRAALAMGANYNTYAQHENGVSAISKNAAMRYAEFFRVSLDWLMRGKGAMKPARPTPTTHPIPLDGVVGAGARILPVADLEHSGDTVDLPVDGTLGAFRVTGESQYPRFNDGEVLLYDRRPALPADLVNKLAVVQLESGERLVKTLRRGRGDLWTLESHNAPPEHDVKILAAWRVIGVLTA